MILISREKNENNKNCAMRISVSELYDDEESTRTHRERDEMMKRAEQYVLAK